MSKGTLKEIRIGGGLNPTPDDDRDFPLGAIYKLPALEEIPFEDFNIDLLKIKDQGQSDMCTAYASTSASEVQEQKELSPEWQFAKIKELDGDPSKWGANLRQAMKSLVKFGSILAVATPEELRYSDEKNNRDKIAQIGNWDKALGFIAGKYKKASFFKISGPYGLFDNIRATLWQSYKKYQETKNPSDLKVVITGTIWKHGWTVSEGGVIPEQEFSGGFGHAFDLTGQKIIDGEIYIVASLSNGTEIGDEGKFYFSRTTIIRSLKWGGYTVRDIDPELAKYLVKKEWSVSWSWLAKIILFFKNL